jgi:hypothetical protein
MEPVPLAKGRGPDEEWVAAWVAALAKEAAGVAWAALAWDLEGIAFAPVVARRWRTKWACPATRSRARSAGSR